jgi:hypothetical protein
MICTGSKLSKVRCNMRTSVRSFASSLVAAMGVTLLMAPSASAANQVVSDKYSGEFAYATSQTRSPDGCIVAQKDLLASDKGFGPTVAYYDFMVNECTMEILRDVYGTAPAEAFDFNRNAVHAKATVPLTDGTTLAVDLQWNAVGAPTQQGFSTRIVEPGVYQYVSTSSGSFSEASLSGSPLFDEAHISQSKGSRLEIRH